MGNYISIKIRDEASDPVGIYWRKPYIDNNDLKVYFEKEDHIYDILSRSL